jgi:hypothetical protein
MKRTLTAVGVTFAVLTAAPLARAQAPAKGDFGQQGEFIISADRLFQLFAWDNWTRDQLGGGLGGGVRSATVTDNQTFFSFFYGQSPNPGVDRFFTVPRVGLDYTIIDRLTLGGDLVLVFSVGGSHKTEIDFTNGQTNSTSNDNPGILGFGVAPRVGYILGLSDLFSLWLRGGVSYYVISSKQTIDINPVTTRTDTINQFAIDLEPQFVLTPIPHVGFTAGIDMDIPITGGISQDTNAGGTTASFSGHSSIFYLGVDLGMLVYF